MVLTSAMQSYLLREKRVVERIKKLAATPKGREFSDCYSEEFDMWMVKNK